MEKQMLTYHREGDYLLPDLIPPESPNIGVWGLRRRNYLREIHDGICRFVRLFPQISEA